MRGFVKVVHDITGNFAVSQELRRQAEHDDLTELPNRRLFYERVQRAIVSMRGRHSQRFAVLFVDVDHFKAINDRFGHAVADQLLVSMAERLETSVRSRDIVARIGGDEFAILLADISGAQDASDTADRIRMVMLSPVIVEGKEVAATVSIGIAIAESKHEQVDDIIRDADLAMYRAKAEGRDRAAVFDSSMATQGAIQADPVLVDRTEAASS